MVLKNTNLVLCGRRRRVCAVNQGRAATELLLGGLSQRRARGNAYSLSALPFFGSSTLWMLGSTPPLAIVTVPSSLLSSSSLRIACEMIKRGVGRGVVSDKGTGEVGRGRRRFNNGSRATTARACRPRPKTTTHQLDVARDDAVLLVVARGVARELEHFGGEVLEHGGEVDRRAGADARGVAALLEVARDAADRELQAGLGAAAHGLLGAALSLSAARHGGLGGLLGVCVEGVGCGLWLQVGASRARWGRPL